MCVCVKLTQGHNRPFRLKLCDDLSSLLIPDVLYSVYTVGVLDPEERGPFHHPHVHEFEQK